MGSAGQKLRQYPPYAGFTSLGVCRPNPGIEAAARDLLKRVGDRGIVDVDFRYDARDRTYRMLDVNPRLGATFRLFLSANGLDVARAMYLDLTGASVSATSARTGRRWMVEAYDPLAAFAYLLDGILTFGDWIRSLKNVEETAWLAWDDPVPFAVMCATAPLKRAHTVLARCKARAVASRRGTAAAAPRSSPPGRRTYPH